jgi:Aminopeptidase N
MQVAGEYRPDADAIGRRSLGITALGFWARVENVDAELGSLFARAGNLTERFAAYRIARADGSPELGQQLSDGFLAQADADEVLDLWLSTESINESTATLERVRELTEHPRFAWTNPNRVRAVVGAFAGRNVKAFHTAEGYRFLRDVVIKLDAMNPQIAARLVSPLCQWGRLRQNTLV